MVSSTDEGRDVYFYRFDAREVLRFAVHLYSTKPLRNLLLPSSVSQLVAQVPKVCHLDVAYGSIVYIYAFLYIQLQ